MFVKYQKGEIARAKVLLRAVEKGILVSVPVIEARYDLVLDIDNCLKRIQVKYSDSCGKRVSGSVDVDLRSDTRGNKKIKTYSKEEVDLILVYLPKIDKIIAIFPDLFDGKQTLTFRYDNPKNGQIKRIRFVDDYLW